MHNKKDYLRLKNHINDIYSPKVYGRYHFPLVVENKENHWYKTTFSVLVIQLGDTPKDVPNIEFCFKDFCFGYTELMATLAHEVGHYISWKNKEGPSDGITKKYYSGKPYSNNIKNLVLGEEKRAWRYGLQFLEDCDFDICPEMLKYKKRCLRSYNDHSNKATAEYYKNK